MRMINSEDKRAIAACSEHLSDETVNSLSIMNRGEALLLGEWVTVPTVVEIEQIARKVGNDIAIADGWKKNKEKLEQEKLSKESLA